MIDKRIPKSMSENGQIVSQYSSMDAEVFNIPIPSSPYRERVDSTDDINVARVEEAEIMSEKRSLVGSS